MSSDTEALMKLKVAEIRDQLETRGLDTKGIKPTLVARLQEAFDAEEKDGKLKPIETQTIEKAEEDCVGTPLKTRRLSGNITTDRPSTPVRKSRRLSETIEDVTIDRPSTPIRKSRRLSETIEDRPETPTRKSRRLSGNLQEERPETPTRKQRRTSGGVFDMIDEIPTTPTRRSRRLSGLVEEANPGEVENILLEDQLTALGSPMPSRRTSGSSRIKRTSQLGGASIAPIPEIPEVEEIEETKSADENSSQLVGTSIAPILEIPEIEEIDETNSAGKIGGTSIAPILEIPEVQETEETNSACQLGGASIAPIPEIPEIEEIDETNSVSKIGGTSIAPIPEIPEVQEIEETNSADDKVVNIDGLCLKTESGNEEEKITEEFNGNVINGSETKTDELNSVETVPDKKENLPIPKVLEKIIVAKHIPRQKPKSGKFWKEGRQQFRQIKRDRGKRFTFEQRLKMKEEKTKNKELAEMLLNRKNSKKEEMRKKIEENKSKKMENEKKSEHYQVIKNPAKIKRMKKKQLRMLEKRDVLTAPAK